MEAPDDQSRIPPDADSGQLFAQAARHQHLAFHQHAVQVEYQQVDAHTAPPPSTIGAAISGSKCPRSMSALPREGSTRYFRPYRNGPYCNEFDQGQFFMEWIAHPEFWASLVTLTALEIVLGVDNVIFISIVASRLPEKQRAKARRLGLTGALVLRVAMLTMLVWMVGLTQPVFSRSEEHT